MDPLSLGFSSRYRWIGSISSSGGVARKSRCGVTISASCFSTHPGTSGCMREFTPAVMFSWAGCDAVSVVAGCSLWASTVR